MQFSRRAGKDSRGGESKSGRMAAVAKASSEAGGNLHSCASPSCSWRRPQPPVETEREPGVGVTLAVLLPAGDPRTVTWPVSRGLPGRWNPEAPSRSLRKAPTPSVRPPESSGRGARAPATRRASRESRRLTSLGGACARGRSHHLLSPGHRSGPGSLQR